MELTIMSLSWEDHCVIMADVFKDSLITRNYHSA